jgi:hypothetical protein
MNETKMTTMMEDEADTELPEGAEMQEKVFLFVVTAVTILLDQFSKTAVSF